MVTAKRISATDCMVSGTNWELIFRNVVERGVIWVSWKRKNDRAPAHPKPRTVSIATAKAKLVLGVPLQQAA